MIFSDISYNLRSSAFIRGSIIVSIVIIASRSQVVVMLEDRGAQLTERVMQLGQSGVRVLKVECLDLCLQRKRDPDGLSVRVDGARCPGGEVGELGGVSGKPREHLRVALAVQGRLHRTVKLGEFHAIVYAFFAP